MPTVNSGPISMPSQWIVPDNVWICTYIICTYYVWLHIHICLCMRIHIQMCTHSIFISVNIHLHALISHPTPQDPPRFFLSIFVMRTVVSVRHIEYMPFLTSAQSLLSGPSTLMWQVPLLSRSASQTSSHPIPACGCHLQLNIPCQGTPQEEHVFNPLDFPTYQTACFAPLSTKTHTRPPLCHCKLTPVRLSHTYNSRRQRDWRGWIDIRRIHLRLSSFLIYTQVHAFSELENIQNGGN